MAKIKGISHLGICVNNVDEVAGLLEDCFGAKLISKTPVKMQKQISAMVSLGGGTLELMEPTSDDSVVAKFLKENGEGLHHISISVDDVSELVKDLEAKGVRIVGKIPPNKPIFAFAHPKSMHGILIELTQL